MKAVVTHGTFDEAVSNASVPVQEIAQRARALILDVYPDVTEVAWPKQGIVGYGVGPKKMSEHFCYIGLYRNRVNLGFFYGADLEDPEGLLEGTGKKLRHVKVVDPAVLENPAVRGLVRLALEERVHALGLER
jgi:hypothetical protein